MFFNSQTQCSPKVTKRFRSKYFSNPLLYIKKVFPVGIYLLKINNRNTTVSYEICWKLTAKTPERRNGRRSLSFCFLWTTWNLVLVFLLLTLNTYFSSIAKQPDKNDLENLHLKILFKILYIVFKNIRKPLWHFYIGAHVRKVESEKRLLKLI